MDKSKKENKNKEDLDEIVIDARVDPIAAYHFLAKKNGCVGYSHSKGARKYQPGI